MMLHAGIADRRSWSQVAEVISDVSTVVAYDRRGYGETEPSSSPFTHVDDLTAVLDATGFDSALLVRSSAGGGVALDYVLTQPERVSGILLVSPAISHTPSFENDPATALIKHEIELAENEDDVGEVNQLETSLWLDGPSAPEERGGGSVRDLVLRMNEIALRNEELEERPSDDVDAWESLETIQQPTVVQCGELDVPFVVKRSRLLAERLPNGRFELLEDVAHLPFMERPNTLTRSLRNLLDA